MNLHQMAIALGGQIVSQGVLCPGPGHSPEDRSLSVTIRGGDVMVHSYAGDNWRVCKDYVRAKLGLADQMHELPIGLVRLVAPMSVNGAERRAQAEVLWHQASSITGTPAELYLGSRGLHYHGDALRWHPSCPFGGDRLGCMVGLVRNITTNRPQAIHRTAIDPAGRKLIHAGANGRMSLGRISGGAVKLTDDAEVSHVLAIGEGIETTSSLRHLPDLGNMPVWSLLSAVGLERFPVLPGIETVWLVADNDVSGTGYRAVQAAAARLTASGVESIVVSTTAADTDLNDKVAGYGSR